jgi:hypothetical protein
LFPNALAFRYRLSVIGIIEPALNDLIGLIGMIIEQHALKRIIVHRAKLSGVFYGYEKISSRKSALGEYGAVAIHREMSLNNCPAIPSIRTINRILKRQ